MAAYNLQEKIFKQPWGIGMSLVQDLLKEVPLSAVLQERVKLAEDKFNAATREIEHLKLQITALERDNAKLRAQIPESTDALLSADTQRVLVHLFRATELEDRGVRTMSHALGMDTGVVNYHLDRLKDAKFAVLTSAGRGDVYWALAAPGRRHVVEHKLI
jgi:hypothetical protein